METYGQRLTEAVEAEARGADVLIDEAALPGALPDETVSHHAARRAAEGARPWCLLCAFLSWAVEQDHCPKTLSDTSEVEPASVYWRAAFWFLVAAVFAWAVLAWVLLMMLAGIGAL